MSETSSFVDPVFLQRFGLSRKNALDYFLHPLNPFRTKTNNTSNEVLAMQGTGIATLMDHGPANEGPMSPPAAEEEYNRALAQLTGEQYELLPPAGPPPPATLTTEELYEQASELYTIRHVLRTSANNVKVLGLYYIVQGVIYKSPAARSLMKTHVARCALDGLLSSCTALATNARYQPSLGYTWIFEDDVEDPVQLQRYRKNNKKRKILDHRQLGERTAAEEEGIRASEAIDQILVRLSKSKWVRSSHDVEEDRDNNINVEQASVSSSAKKATTETASASISSKR